MTKRTLYYTTGQGKQLYLFDYSEYQNIFLVSYC